MSAAERPIGAPSPSFAPAFAGGWLLSRWLFALAALHAHLRRGVDLQDAFFAPDISFGSGPLHFGGAVHFSAPTAGLLWLAGLVGLGLLLRGGRAAKPGLLLWLACTLGLIAGGGLLVRVAERFTVWASLVLLLAPIDQRDLLQRPRSTYPRALLLVIFGSLYLSTGLMKALEEPRWWDGVALQYDLLDRNHAGGALAAAISGQPWLVRPMAWFTLAFELGFVPLMFSRRLRGPTLLAGVLMHVGIGVLMKVGALGEVALALYPALLHPDEAAALWARLGPRLPAGLRRRLGAHPNGAPQN
jgi:hypothetical protein